MQAKSDIDDQTDTAEFVTRILTLYPANALRQERASLAPLGAARVERLIGEARQAFERRGEAGDGVAAAVMALTASGWDASEIAAMVVARFGQSELIATSIAPGRSIAEVDRLAPIFYDLAVVDVENGRTERAAVLLAMLLHLSVEIADAIAGLAVCGARLGKYDEALILATECLKLPLQHPRAYFVAGLCELKRGNRKSAQSLLATAARFARKHSEFRADLHAAQRLLLILHYG